MIKNKGKYILLVGIIIFLFSSNIKAQGLGDPECDPILGCPIDDNVWVLFAVVALFAIRKIYLNYKSLQKA